MNITDTVDISLIVSWSQAVVAVVLILAELIGPQIGGWINAAKTQAQMKNNGGSTLRDAVDRIENRLDSIEKRLHCSAEN